MNMRDAFRSAAGGAGEVADKLRAWTRRYASAGSEPRDGGRRMALAMAARLRWEADELEAIALQTKPQVDRNRPVVHDCAVGREVDGAPAGSGPETGQDD